MASLFALLKNKFNLAAPPVGANNGAAIQQPPLQQVVVVVFFFGDFKSLNRSGCTVRGCSGFNRSTVRGCSGQVAGKCASFYGAWKHFQKQFKRAAAPANPAPAAGLPNQAAAPADGAPIQATGPADGAPIQAAGPADGAPVAGAPAPIW